MTFEQFKIFCKKDWPEADLKKHFERWAKDPLAKYGEIAYYFTGSGKRGGRIIVYIHHEKWLERNRRVHGTAYHMPFLKREMNEMEILEAHLNFRQEYYQYDSWDDLMVSEMNINDDIDFIEKLESFRDRYRFSLNGTTSKKVTLNLCKTTYK